jgi:hypothetical protein
MQKVKVKKDELITVVEQNRAKHQVVYEKATKDYRTSLIGLIEDKLKAAKAGEDVSHRINISKPMQFMKEYDSVLAMLKMSIDTEIELTPHEFNQYVQDEWGWKEDFFSNTRSLRRMSETYGG